MELYFVHRKLFFFFLECEVQYSNGYGLKEE